MNHGNLQQAQTVSKQISILAQLVTECGVNCKFSNVNTLLREACQKKNSGYNEFGTKGGGVSDLNHYLKQL